MFKMAGRLKTYEHFLVPAGIKMVVLPDSLIVS